MADIKDMCEVDRILPIHQLNKLNEKGTERQDFFPLSVIQAIYDKTGIRLDTILSEFNYIFLPYKGSKEDTRLQVLSTMRRRSLVITYRDLDNNTITEMYNANEIGDNTWKDSNNWIDFNDYIVEIIKEQFNENIPIIDNLESTDSKAALSANQGRVLKELIDDTNADISDINNSISSINEAISSINQLEFNIVTELPATGQTGICYLVLNDESTDDNNVYDEYIWITSSNKYEKLGSFTTNVDLSDYITNSQLTSALANKQDTLVSGTNIKTINNQSLLGEGNINIEGGDSLPSGGTTGQVLTKTSDGYAWQDPQAGDAFPEGGTVGQVLKKTADGVEWGDDNDTQVIVNNTLTSTSTSQALSAAQGKVLKDLIDQIDVPDEYDLPIASTTQLGGVKVGQGIDVTSDGTISAADDVVQLSTLVATTVDIALACAAGPFNSTLYLAKSPLTSGSITALNTGDDYYLCVRQSSTLQYYQTTCSNVADSFSSYDNFTDYFVVSDTSIYLKNNIIYQCTLSSSPAYFVSDGYGDTLTNVAKKFDTLAEARAYMREKMLKLPDINIVKLTQTEYDDALKDSNTLYIIQG